MRHSLLIFFGAGAGGVFRYLISCWSYLFLGYRFPYGTLIVNASGCWLMGLLFVVISQRFAPLEPSLRSLLLIGLLGGFTTFSSFSIETLIFIEREEWFNAGMNIFLSVFLCLSLTWLGIIAGRQLCRV